MVSKLSTDQMGSSSDRTHGAKTKPFRRPGRYRSVFRHRRCMPGGESALLLVIGTMMGIELIGVPAMIAIALAMDVDPVIIPWLAVGLTSTAALGGAIVMWLWPPAVFQHPRRRAIIRVGRMGQPAQCWVDSRQRYC